MKQIYSKLILLLAMILVGNSAWADDVTFTFKTDEDITYTKTGTSGGGAECIVSKSDVTLSGTNAYTTSAKSLIVYAKSTLTITAPGNITSVEILYNGNVYPFDEAVGDGNKGEKFPKGTGNHTGTYSPATPSTSITLTNPNGGKTELNSLKVTYVAGSVVKVTGVSLDASTKELTEGESFTLAATVAPADATTQLITWSSSDEKVATVKDGEVSAIAPGNATITVKTVDGNFTASCDVTVKAAPEPDEYVFLFAPANADGDSSSSLTSSTALSKAFAEGAPFISSITAEKVYPARNSLGYGVKFGSSSAAGTITINLKKPIPATYIVVSAAAYGDAEGQQGFTINGTKVDMAASQNKVYCDYAVKLDGSDLSTITLTQSEANKGRIYVQYIRLIKAEGPFYGNCTRKLIAKEDGSYYGTFSSDKVTFFPEDYIVSAVGVENGELYTFSNEEAFDDDRLDVNGEEVVGYYVPANTGVFIKSIEPLVEYFTVEGITPSNDVDAVNMLRPASEGMTGDFKFYKLAYDDAEAKTDLGFYYGTEDGATFTCNAGLAYLAVPTPTASKVRGFVLNSEATAITSVSAASKTAKSYNLQGQQVSADYKGIVISNGKKIYNK